MIDKIKKIMEKIKYVFITIFPSFLIGCFCGLLIGIYNLKKDLPEIPINNKEIIQEDKIVFNEHLNANGKDIIIILDFFNFNMYQGDHGNQVNLHLFDYLNNNLKKNDDIYVINLSFDETKNNIENINLLKEDQSSYDFKQINKETYQLEKYISIIRELNPNSKIVLSLSLVKFFINDKIIELSKKYNYKIAQSYVNFSQGGYINRLNILDFIIKEFIYSSKNTMFVTLEGFGALWYNKQISLKDTSSKINKNRLNNYSTSFLTPILAYEYYLNKETNIINKDLLKLREKEFK